MKPRTLTTLGMWTIELNADEPRHYAHKSEAAACLSDIMHQHASGSLSLNEDVGLRSRFMQIVFGMWPRILLSHFAVEWCGPTASLIFLDEAGSEYRALDRERPVQADERTRKAIAHGELTPHPLEQCMELQRAQQAIAEYLQTGQRPAWLQYLYVE